MTVTCISSEEANPAFSGGGAKPHGRYLFGDMADTLPASALIAWIVVFERSEGVKGKPLSGGKAALDALVAFKKDAIQAIKASLRPPCIRGSERSTRACQPCSRTTVARVARTNRMGSRRAQRAPPTFVPNHVPSSRRALDRGGPI